MSDPHERTNPIFTYERQKALSYRHDRYGIQHRLLINKNKAPVTPGFVSLARLSAYSPFLDADGVFVEDAFYSKTTVIQKDGTRTNTASSSHNVYALLLRDISYDESKPYADTTGLTKEQAQKVQAAQAIELYNNAKNWLKQEEQSKPLSSISQLTTHAGKTFETLSISKGRSDGVDTYSLADGGQSCYITAHEARSRAGLHDATNDMGHMIVWFPACAAGTRIPIDIKLEQDPILIVDDQTSHTLNPVLEIWTLPGEFDNSWPEGVNPVLHASYQLPPLDFSVHGNDSNMMVYKDEWNPAPVRIVLPPSRAIIPVIRLLPSTVLDYFLAHCPMKTDEDGFPQASHLELYSRFALTITESQIGR